MNQRRLSNLDHHLDGVHVWKEAFPRHSDQSSVVDSEHVVRNWRQSGEFLHIMTPQQSQCLPWKCRHTIWTQY